MLKRRSSRLPPRISRNSGQRNQLRSQAHLKWVRGHVCSACGSGQRIEAAHVRRGTDGGVGVKPSDIWTISLCSLCHAEQHRLGEAEFEVRYALDMKALAQEFAAKSPALRRKRTT